MKLSLKTIKNIIEKIDDSLYESGENSFEEEFYQGGVTIRVAYTVVGLADVDYNMDGENVSTLEMLDASIDEIEAWDENFKDVVIENKEALEYYK